MKAARPVERVANGVSVPPVGPKRNPGVPMMRAVCAARLLTGMLSSSLPLSSAMIAVITLWRFSTQLNRCGKKSLSSRRRFAKSRMRSPY